MFGSKKRKEKREAIRAEATAERQETLAAFEKRAEDIAAMTDTGEKLFALTKLSEDAATRVRAENKKIEDAGETTVANIGGTIGVASLLAGIGSGVALLGTLLSGGAFARLCRFRWRAFWWRRLDYIGDEKTGEARSL